MLYDPMKCRLNGLGEKRIIWVFPTYSWGVPPAISRFITEVNFTGVQAINHYMVTTCGDDIGQTADMWRKLINHRKWVAATAYSVTMPNTYVLMKGFDVDSPEVVAAKMGAMPARVEAVASAIKRGFADSDVVRGSWAWVKTAIVYPYFRRFCMSPRPFHATDACITCGLCARSCPMENIGMADGRPRWGNRCALCLRCYHTCPTHAVAYGSATAAKGQKTDTQS